MQLSELMAALSTLAIRLQREDQDLLVQGDDEALDDTLWDSLVEHKARILELLDQQGGDWLSPAFKITPDMLPLVRLDPPAIERIVAGVPGGAANVQDIYPLAPLQEGMLYHHLSAAAGDPYVLQARFAFASEGLLRDFTAALQWVIERHDILRTAIAWESLDEPLQVVWRHAPLVCEEIALDPAEGDVLEQLQARYDARHLRLDLRQAPLLRLVHARDPANRRQVALLLFHHMALDHAALDVVRQEIRAWLLGHSDRLPAPVPFRNHLAQARLAQEQGQHDAFFREMLGDIDEPTLPFGLGDVQGAGRRIEEHRATLDPNLSQRLRSQARQLGVSVASLLHLALARVLGQVSGREAVVFGTVLLGRMEAGAGGERALGMFINTLPLRVDVGAQGVRAGVLATHRRLTDLLGHEHASLAQAQRCSGVQAPTPLFSAMLNYRHSHADDGAQTQEVVPGIQVLGAQERTNYPLTINVDDLGEDLRIIALVDARIGAVRITGYLLGVLESLALALQTTPEAAVHSLEMLPASERHYLLHGLNTPPGHYPDTVLIHQQVEAQARVQPEAPALIFQGQRLSYGQLNQRANQVAHRLLALGVRPDQRVAICVERGLEMIIGLLGILKAGGAYVPIDPAYPRERIAYTLQDSAPVALLVQADTQALVADLRVPLIDLDSRSLAHEALDNPEVAGLNATHLAYVIYTSGSTGLPKGVMVEHRNVARLFAATRDWFDFNWRDVWALFHSFAFDFSVWEIWGALVHGGQLLVVPQAVSRSPDACYALLCEASVSILNQTPSAFRSLIAAQGRSALKHSLRQVIFGGEALEPGMLKPWYARVGNVGTQLVNMYGITETTVHVTYRPLQAADAQLVGISPIGRRIPDLQLYVLDARREPLPVGVVGELYVGGAGVARGYLNRDQLTAERFIDDPFSARAGARLYKTGDLARWRTDGSLEYLGRNDDQVKIRGFRIELGEIEARLAACAGVREAVVVAREDVHADKRLVAYFIAQPGEQPNATQLREQLRQHLADYMLPSAFVLLDSLPLTTNGKLDRKALPAPDSQAVARRDYEAPQGDVEQSIARIWQELLQLPQVGRQDNFFELGGHSLLAVKLMERMRQVDLCADVRVLFGQPTLAALAAAVGAGHEVSVPANLIAPDCPRITPDLLPLADLDQAAIDRVVATVPGGTANVQDIYAVAPLQAGILYHHLSSTQGDPYLLQVQFEFADESSLETFIQAMDQVIQRHDILRTSLVWEGLDEAVQVVWRQAPLAVQVLSVEPAKGSTLKQLQARFDPRHYRLDLGCAPLMRLVCAQDPGQARWLGMLLFHHLALDHTSLEVLVEEISAVLQGRATQLPPATPYRNYVAQARLGLDEAQHQEFFHDLLGDIDEPTLAFGLQDVNRDGQGIQERQLRLDPLLCRRLRERARALGVSVASLVHLAWGRVLGQLSGRDEVVFGTVLLGRMQGGAGADRALGMFINTLPLRVSLGGQGVEQALRDTHARLSQLLGHEHASLALAQRCSGVPAALPLFNSLLNYRHSARSTDHEQALAIWEGIRVLDSQERSNYPLVVNVDDDAEGLRLTVQAVAQVDGARVCDYLACALEHLGQALEQSPALALGEIPVLPQAERRQILVDFNATTRDYPRQQALHQRFEEQVLERPQQVAAVHGQEVLSYAQLNARANQLAHHLLSLGVKPGAHLALLLPRSIDLLVGQLAASKCGVAYVPLDGNAPASRQAFMVQDSQSVMLLTRSDQLLDVPVPRLELDRLSLQGTPTHNPDLQLSSEAVAYIMYTSGSTGEPKGVLVPHRAITRLVINNGYADFNTGDRVAFASNPAFDASTLDVWGPLLNGGRVVVVDHQTLLDPPAFAQLLQASGVTMLFLTTSLFNQYVQLIPQALKGLRMLLCGGERADATAFRRMQAQAPGLRLVNGYGPTETTTFAVTHEPWELPADADSLPIGRPLSNTQVYILDTRQQPLPIGVAGEIVIGGDGVALGYLNRPELNAQKFIDDPFGERSGALLYRTGDIGRWLDNGLLEYLGRSDDQVKIRGLRIEPGEIEARLLACPGVKDGVILVREDEPGEQRLVAYYRVQQDAPSVSAQSLRATLLQQLPEYMVPLAYVRLDTWPLTANGKLDRKALPAPPATAMPGREFVAPQGDVEIALARIWSDLLKVERVGRHDHFFELGGHSLLAVSLIERMRQIGLGADVRVLFSQPTLAALAGAVGTSREVQVPANRIAADCQRITPDLLPLIELDQPAIDRIVAQVPGGVANVQDIYPLAPLQEGILYHHLSAGQGDPYLLQSRMAFDSLERLQRFASGLQQVIARHDILRTAVLWQGLPQPVQVVWREARLQVLEQHLDPAEGDVLEQLHQRFDARHWRLDLAQAPLIRMVHAFDPVRRQVVAILLFHHLALDHTAMEVIGQEMHELLFNRGQHLGTPVPYRNYVAQARLGAGEAEHEAFFQDMLADIDEPTLAFAVEDVQGEGHDIDEAHLALPAALAGRLREQARQLGVSAAALMHLAWALVLGQVANRRQVVFGTVLMGRMQGGEGADRALGVFINTLPLRVDVQGVGVRDGVRATHARLSALLGHEHASLALAQRCSAVASGSPLFNALLNYRHSAPPAAAAGQDIWQGVELLGGEERSNYPLSLSVDDLGDGFSLSVLALARIGAQRLGGYMACALEQLVAALEHSPELELGQLSVLPLAERERLLRDFNASTAAHPRGQTLHGLFETRVRAAPDAVALVQGPLRLSYRQLDQQANQLARKLLAFGVQPDDRVALCMARGPQLLQGMLAVLKAGAAYVPIDPSHPAERIAYLVQDSAPRALLVAGGLSPVPGVPVLDLDREVWSDSDPDTPQVPRLTPAHLAYVIYTSGSTGQPKGVMVEHQSLENLVHWHCQAFDLGPGRHASSLAGLGFDAMAWEVWPTLCSGATLHLPPADIGAQDIERLLAWWRDQPLDVSFLPTPVAEYAFNQQLRHPTLRTLLIGGDRLRQFARDPGFTVVNNYGPTEATVVATSGALVAGGALHIGRPMANARIYLLDELLRPVPVGVAGELYVGGAGVARGYLNRPELTAERFLDDPFSAEPGARMYRSGDLARWREDGTLDYLGRNDDQVKVRGMRIEPGEIEAALLQHPALKEALVLVSEGRLLAYFTCTPATGEPSAEDLRDHLQGYLPDYMVPVAYVVLAALPLTANGKLDRRALPEPGQGAWLSREFEAPQGEVEIALARIWSELLKVEQVGRHDHFFELGGHSLLAVTLVERMRQAGLAADVRVLFEQPTLAALAATTGSSREVPVPDNRIPSDCQHITPSLLSLVELDQQAIDRVLATVPGGAANVQDIYPLAPLQEGILYHHLSAREGDPYLLQSHLAFASRQRLEDFAAALQRVGERHDILRTAILWEGLKQPLQVVWREAPVALEEVDLDPADGDILQQLHQRFDPRHWRLDLTRAPLLRLVFAQDPVRQGVVAILLFHHIVLDHTALEVVREEIQACLLGQQPAGAAIPYRNYVAQARLGVTREEHEAFFREMLGDIDAPTLPFGLQDVQGDGDAIEEVQQAVDATLAARLRAQARLLGVSAASLFHLAWARVLNLTTGQERVVFGTVLLGRLQAGQGADRALGMFINTLPLRVDLDAGGVRAAVKATHARLSALLGHEHASLALAQRCSGVAAPLPLFSAMLNYRHGSDAPPSEAVRQAWQGIETLHSEERTNYPLSLNVDDFGQGLRLTAMTPARIGAARVCGYLQQALLALVDSLEQAPQRSLLQVPILPEAERRQLLEGFNATARDYPLEQTLHGLFEAQVLRSPEALAVQAGEQRLSYRQLNQQANQLAGHLLQLGVGPDQRVAICVERSVDMVLGLLAILKAGGAYVPIDPAYPQERIDYMLQDSAPLAVLVQGATRHLAQASGLALLDLDQPQWAGQSRDNPQLPHLTPRHLAYVIYTSGSTGQPKGAMNEHRAVVNRLLWMQEQYRLDVDDAVLQKTPFSFDVSVWEFFWPLFTGARLVMARPEGHKDPAYLRQLIREQGISTLHFVPSMLDVFLVHDATPDDLGLRQVMCSGEALPGSLVRRFKQQLPNVALHNLYGPTEAAVDVTAWDCTGPLDATPDNTPIGKPIANTRLYLLDAQLQPVPLGVVGELFIAGVQVARGYLNREQLTAERFVDDPFSAEPDARMYRTGDLGRYLADGNIEYLGRNDDQVKIRGLRIELGEIQARLTQLEGIKEAVVLAREDVPGDKRLVAYYTSDAGHGKLPVEQLRQALLEHLPDYMVPALYVHLEALPLSPNGKLERKALPAPGVEAAVVREYEAPVGDTEILLAQLWAELLNVERVGRHDHFFELGGHSLLAVNLISRMREHGMEADVRGLFEQPTLAGYAAMTERMEIVL
ncbi:amino acid adenylation domain-containing protein [Pseudomonas sp. BIOMIG1BAC]|uniref:non-ribosomal peptide synthetase n=5 Tax=unclassified Pseudomonas TaxID=196821 RepID=UPI0013E0F71F|nr:non-ribosomal peptide synthetase [Pseudomonas sp. BIOMIG1BAC]QIH08992.1 amino acid adenylation domain-containing protein [Pseudomonas sp. BIOMIG1BAC]